MFLFGLPTACSTMGEVMYENSSVGEYKRTKDDNGHTKYERRRIIANTPSSSPPPPLFTFEPTTFTSSFASADTAHQLESSTANNDLSLGGGLVISSSANANTFNGDISYEWLGEYVSGGAGVAMVGSDRTYFGFTGQVRAHFPWKLTPFVGVGLYAGDSKTCRYEPIGGGYTEEICDKYYLFAATADIGAQYSFSKNVHARLFSRTFSQTRQGDPLRSVLYGASVALSF